MYEFHYDYMLPKYGINLKLYYMDTDSLETEDFYEDFAKAVPMRFDMSGCCKDRSLHMGFNEKAIGLMTNELGGAKMTVCCIKTKAVFLQKARWSRGQEL